MFMKQGKFNTRNKKNNSRFQTLQCESKQRRRLVVKPDGSYFSNDSDGSKGDSTRHSPEGHRMSLLPIGDFFP